MFCEYNALFLETGAGTAGRAIRPPRLVLRWLYSPGCCRKKDETCSLHFWYPEPKECHIHGDAGVCVHFRHSEPNEYHRVMLGGGYEGPQNTQKKTFSARRIDSRLLGCEVGIPLSHRASDCEHMERKKQKWYLKHEMANDFSLVMRKGTMALVEWWPR